MTCDGASVTTAGQGGALPPRPSSLVGLLRGRAEERPARPAFAYPADGTGAGEGPVVTAGGLDARARALAAWLQARGLEGERVLLVFPPGLDFVAAFFGCLYAGAVAVPASPPRPNRPMTRLRAVVDDARPSALLTTAGLLPAARAWLEQVPGLAEAQWLGVDAAPDALARVWREPALGLETLAFLQYTSGSTATPKGVRVTHGNLLHNSSLIGRSFAANRASRGVFWLPLFHDMGLIGGVIQTLACGGFSTLMSPVAFLQRPVRWLEAVSRTGATISGGPNFAYDLCARKVTDEQKAGLDLSRWAVAFNGAEPVRAETLDRFAEAFAPCGFRREAFLPCYGLAESTLMVTGKRAEDPPRVVSVRPLDLEQGRAVATAAGEPGARTLVGSGRAFEGLRVEVVDPAGASALPEGRIGEIWVQGPSVAAGYWGRPEASAETFGARLDGGDGPFLRTGDLGFLTDGELFVTGRSKDLLIVRGRNVYPQDVEWSVAGCHPLARAEGGAAFAVEAGGEERLVVVQEVERLGKGLDPEEVFRAVREAVAVQHDLDVHAVRLIKAMSLPKTSSGKVQRHACREAFLAGTLDVVARWTAETAEESGRAPETPQRPMSVVDPPPTGIRPVVVGGPGARPASEVERWLVARMAATLGLDPGAVDLRRPFAAFGLGSLQAVGLAGELEEWLDRPLSPTLVYDHPTIETLARHLAGGDLARADGDRRDTTAAAPIAIVGIGCRFPGADGPEAFWELLSRGVDAVGAAPVGRRGAGRSGAKKAGFLERVDLFDAAFFGISPREAVWTDPQQRLVLEVAWEALEDAGLAADGLRGKDVGVFLGVSTNDYGRGRLGAVGAKEAYAVTGNALSVAANRVSYVFDFRGPSLAVDTACSSSLVALHLACESLRRGEASLALAGGVNVVLAGEITETFAAAGFLSPEGRCKAFDASADGYVRGEGAGVVVLKPMALALADGDPVYAVVRGSAVNQDGRSNGLTAPNRDAQEAVLRAAYRRAGVAPGAVDYVEAHGAGTLLGDPIEAAALAAVLGEGRPEACPCAVGSVKTNVGHLEAAAGVAGLIKVALAMDRGRIPASLHFREPNPHIPFSTMPIRVQAEPGAWPERDRPWLAGVSAFGFGGANAHALLEAAPRSPAATDSNDAPGSVLIPLSAQGPEALKDLARSYLDRLGGGEAPPLADVAHTAGARRSHHDQRLVVLARSRAEAVARLEAFLRGEPGSGVATGRRSPSRRPRSVFVFSGQGAQWPGMGRGLAEAEPVFRAAVAACDRLLRPLLGWSVAAELESGGDPGRLDETGYAQPVVFTLQVGLTALWRSWGVVPDAVVGHSLGEIAAAHAAGALDLEDAVRVVAHRARLMQSTVGQGHTAAVALPAVEALALVADDPKRLALAGVNGPNASVISGDPDAVLSLVRTLRARGVFAKVLSGRCAFHGPRMDPLRDELRAALAGIKPRASTVAIVSTVTGLAVEGDQLGPEYWARNLRETVRFEDAVALLAVEGHDAFLEIGPHPALGPAVVETLEARGRSSAVLASLRRGEEGRDVLLGSLGTLYARGFPIAWDRLTAPGRFCRLPTYPFQRERFWLDVVDEPRHATNGHAPASSNGNGARNGHVNGKAPAPTHPAAPRVEPAGIYEIEWQPRERPVGAAEPGRGTWLIFEDERGVGPALRARLEASGGRCVAVARGGPFERLGPSLFRVDTGRAEEVRRLLDEVRTDGPIAGVVHLGSLDAPSADRMTLADLDAARSVGCESVLALVQAMGGARALGSPRVWVVTAGAQPAGSPASASEPLAVAQATVWGLGRSVALERPGLWGGLVDLDPRDAPGGAAALAAELLGAGGEDQVAFRRGQRFVARLVRRQRLEDLPGSLPLRPDGTYLVTGGLGALGLRVAHRLVEQGARRLVLVGRSGLPDRDGWDGLAEGGESARRVAAVRAMERLGTTVIPASADVADPEAMAALFAELRRTLPPLRGVVHAAGVVTAIGLDALDPEAFAAVMKPKVAGAWVLHELTRTLPLDFFVAFSSVASVLGAKEAHYAAANQFLDALAHHRRATGLPALSVNWGPWEGTGMAAEAGRSRAFALVGLRPLRLDDGLDALAGLVAAGASQAVVADVDWDALKAIYGSDGRRPLLDCLAVDPRSRTVPGGEDGAGFAWRGRSPEESRSRLLGYFRDRLAGVLKLDPARVDPERPIDTMGLDSLMAIELKNGVESDLHTTLPLSVLLQGPTLEELSGRVFDQLSAGGPTPATAPIAFAVETGDPADAPLSAGQRALWSLHQIDPGSPAYNIVGAVRLAGPLDVDALRRSAQRLVDRHPALRTTFPSSQGAPVQRVHPRAEVAFRFEGIEGSGEEDLLARLDREANQAFDLENGPLFRIHVFRRSESEHALLLAVHHVVSDFWSVAVLLDELGRVYPAEVRGGVPELPALSFTPADFARWQSAMVDGPAGDRHWSYWRDRLAGPLPVLNLPTDRPRPPVQTFAGASTLVRLDADLTPRLAELGRSRGASLYTTLLAAFHVLLSRYSGQDDVIVGTPVAGRSQAEAAGVVGYFVNTLPLRARVEPALSFAAFLDQVRATVREGLEHQDYPFPVLAERVQAVRDPSRSPVFQVMFVLQKAQRLDDQGFSSFVLRGSGPTMELGGLAVASIALDVRGAQFDLTVQVAEENGRLAVSAEYNTDLFDAATIDRLLGHYRTLLEAVADDPTRPLWTLPLLTPAEEKELGRWNETGAAVPAVAGVHELFEAEAARAPDAVAVAAADGSLSYRELNARANRLAHLLRGLGVGPDVRVGLRVERSSAMLVGILGILKAGGAYVPLDPDYPPDRLAFQVEDSRAAVLVTDGRSREEFPPAAARVVRLDADRAEIDRQDDRNPAPVAGPGRLAYVIYTSGSTGRPKGVMVTHANLAASTHARWLHDPAPVGRYLLVSSFAFDSSVAGIFWTLTTGGTLVLPAPGAQADPLALAALIERCQASHLLAVPALYSLILEYASSDQLSSLRTVIVAGESCPRDLPTRHFAALPGATLDNEYGPTEATVWATVHRCTPLDSGRDAVSIGRPIANTRAHILDAHLNRVPVGVMGELYLGGLGLARGYHGRPALTAERFLADPFAAEPGGRLYRTGDMARYRPDGVIECLGRLDGQVKIRGYRVELGEVESAMAGHPAVREAAAVARDDPTGETRLVAYLVLRPGVPPSVGELRSWLKTRLPDAMVPSAFALLDALPLSPNGKVDRSAMPAPDSVPGLSVTASEGPRTPTEVVIARLAAELLKVEKVGVHDNFFELGIDSIVAIQLAARARKAGLHLTPAHLFENPTVAGLAGLAEAASTGNDGPVLVAPGFVREGLPDPDRVEDAYPLTPLQEGMLFQARFRPGTGEYVQQFVSVVKGALNLPAFEAAWQRLIDRHPVLRTSFQATDPDPPLQVVYRGVRPSWEVLDWRAVPPGAREGRLDDYLRADRERGFDPAAPPLLRLGLFRLEESAWQLVWTYHHLLFDGWSLQVILRELLALYEGGVGGLPVALPERAPFRDYVAWLSTEDPGRAQPYWRERLKGFRAPTPLGIDRPGAEPVAGAEPYDEQEARVSAETTARLVALGRRRGLTLGTIVQGGWALLLGRYSGRDDVVFGATVSGRSAPVDGVEDMVGLLINTLPVRVAIDGRTPVLAWLDDLQSRLVEMRRYEATALVDVQGWSEVPRTLPLFESLVVFENYPVDETLRSRAGGLGFGAVRVWERTDFPLTLMAFPGDRLALRLIYDARRFDAAAVARLLGHLGCLLDAIADQPERPIDALPILTTDEMRQILDQWNERRIDPESGRPGGPELARAGVDLDRLSDEDVDALIGEYLGRDEAHDE